MRSFTTSKRTTRSWIGATTAAAIVVSGAAACGQASSSGSTQSPGGPGVTVGSSSANDPHELAAQSEAGWILTTFQPPPGAHKDGHQPNPVPSGLRRPPTKSSAQTQAAALGWYSTTQSPEQVLAWVRAHPPTGSSPLGSGSGDGVPDFVSYQYSGTPDNSLIITPESDAHGHTVIRLDAVAIWTPSRAPGSRLGYDAPSVSVVTTAPMNPHHLLPANETTTATSSDPSVVHQVVDLINALQPPIPGTRSCPMDDGTRVRITLPGVATVLADPVGCSEVKVVPQTGPPQVYSGGNDLVTKVYALFGVTWTRTGDLPPRIERTGASGNR